MINGLTTNHRRYKRLDNELFKLNKRFEKDNFIIIKDGCLARQLVKKPKIKQMRKNNELLVARDRAKKVTLLFKIPKI